MHASHIVDLLRQLQGQTLSGWAINLLSPARCEIGTFAQAVDPLVVNTWKLRAQRFLDGPIAKSAAYMGNIHDA